MSTGHRTSPDTRKSHISRLRTTTISGSCTWRSGVRSLVCVHTCRMHLCLALVPMAQHPDSVSSARATDDSIAIERGRQCDHSAPGAANARAYRHTLWRGVRASARSTPNTRSPSAQLTTHLCATGPPSRPPLAAARHASAHAAPSLTQHAFKQTHTTIMHAGSRGPRVWLPPVRAWSSDRLHNAEVTRQEDDATRRWSPAQNEMTENSWSRLYATKTK